MAYLVVFTTVFTVIALTTPSLAQGVGSSQWQQTIIDAHNVHRANHSSPDIQWHDGLAAAAQMVANNCIFAHDVNTGKNISGFEDGYGQNLACPLGGHEDDPTKDISGSWYGEEGPFAASGSYGLSTPNPAYNVDSNGHQTQVDTGHFTAVVWKGTSYVGCGLGNCPNGVANTFGNTEIFVCNYGPMGNLLGQFASNVLPPLGFPPSADTNY